MSHRYKGDVEKSEETNEPRYVRTWRKELDKAIRNAKPFDSKASARIRDLKERIADYEAKQAEESDFEYEV